MKGIHAEKRVLMIVVGLAAVFLSALNWELADATPPHPSPMLVAGNRESSQETGTGFPVLKGRWRRMDGGYVIDIRSVEPSGKVDAAYFNPNPIRISEAEATQEGSATKVFIELRDTGYPGCTYTLTYDPQTDQLRGVYFQAAIRQKFNVIFFRIR